MTKATAPISASPQEMDERTWWDHWNQSYRAQDDGGEIPSELFARTAELINRIIKTEGGRVLEIGCGAGALSRRIQFSSYHGLDISPAAIEVARQKTPQSNPSCSYKAADIHDWTVMPEAFDIAVCVDAVAYFRDQAYALKKMAQSIRPGGALVLTTINPFVYHRIKRTTASPLREGSVSHWLSRAELHELMKGAGLAIEQSFTIMPRGNLGFLRMVNSPRLNNVFNERGAQSLKGLKERVGLGQYRVVVGKKRNP